MLIVNNARVEIIHHIDDEAKVLKTYKLGDTIKFTDKNTQIEDIGIISEMRGIKLRIATMDNDDWYAFSDIEPILTNHTFDSSDYYSSTYNDNFILVQGHNVINPGDKCIVTYPQRGIYQEPCIYLSASNDVNTYHFTITFEMLNRDNHLTIRYNHSFEFKNMAGQLIEDNTVYVTKPMLCTNHMRRIIQ